MREKVWGCTGCTVQYRAVRASTVSPWSTWSNLAASRLAPGTFSAFNDELRELLLPDSSCPGRNMRNMRMGGKVEGRTSSK